MSFWKLTKALASAPTDGINGVLAPLKALDDRVDGAPASLPPSSSTSSDPDALSPEDLAAHYRALDTLLAEPDLLSEIKSGSNARLTDFLARKEVVLRLGGWVVWGLGRGFLDPHDAADDENGAAAGRGLDSGLLPDEMEQGQVPDEVLKAGERERKGMGGVPRRRDINEAGKFVEGNPDEETDDERKWAKCVVPLSHSLVRSSSASEPLSLRSFPRLCTEILVSSSPSLTDSLFRHDSASTKPHTCPSPASFLLPFWCVHRSSSALSLR